MALRKNSNATTNGTEAVAFSIALDSFCTADKFGTPHYFSRGERVRSDHWAVAQAGVLFAPDGEPDSVYRGLLSNLYGAHVQGVE
jgi:hypothetical protein